MKDRPEDALIRNRAIELRSERTPAERKLWARLRSQQLGGFRFRQQHLVDRYILDFYCPSTRLAVELDGDSHIEQEMYDSARTTWLTANGYRVLRFTNSDVHENIESVLEAILTECKKRWQR